MAEMGLAPAIFARRAATDTPINCIALQFVMIALLISLDFNQILCIDNFFSASAAILEFLAHPAPLLRSGARPPVHHPARRRSLAALALLVHRAAPVHALYFAAGRGEARTHVALALRLDGNAEPVQGALLKQSAQPEALDPLSPPRSPHGSPNRTPRMSRERMSGERPSGERGSAVHGGTGTIE